MTKERVDPFGGSSKQEVRDDVSKASDFIKTEQDGRLNFRRKGYEHAKIPEAEERPKSKSITEQWKDYHAKK